MTPTQIVLDFVHQWGVSKEAMDRSINTYFTPQTVWENVGMSRTVGGAEALGLLSTFEQRYGARTIKADMLELVAAGNKVLTERVDHLIDGNGKTVVSIRVMGIFEIENDKIVRWRDYFDTAPFPRSQR